MQERYTLEIKVPPVVSVSISQHTLKVQNESIDEPFKEFSNDIICLNDSSNHKKNSSRSKSSLHNFEENLLNIDESPIKSTDRKNLIDINDGLELNEVRKNEHSDEVNSLEIRD